MNKENQTEFFIIEDDDVAYITESKKEFFETIEMLMKPYFKQTEIFDEENDIYMQMFFNQIGFGNRSGFIARMIKD